MASPGIGTPPVAGARRPPRAAEVLTEARALLADPARWTPGNGRAALTLTADGEPTWPRSPEAARWCLAAALQAVVWGGRGDRDGVKPTCIDALAEACLAVAAEAGAWPSKIGARLDHEQVLAVLDRAAERTAG